MTYVILPTSLKKNALFFAKQFLTMLFLLGTLQMIAQPVPFSCSSTFYQYRSSDLISFDIETSGETVINGSSSELLAPRGYNIEDNLIYGYSGSRIFQEDATGNKVYKGLVNEAISGVEAGDFDNLGNLFLYATGILFSVDVDNPPFTAKRYTITGPTGLQINDFAYRVRDGKFYGVASNKKLVSIEITGDTTATITTQNLSGPLTNLSNPDFASAWVSYGDKLYVFEQYGGIYYRVNMETKATTQVRTGVSSLFNDGMSCPILDPNLPLDLLSFGVRAQGNNTVALGWTTANEENVSHFEVMRSTDGLAWKQVGDVNAVNRLGINNYEFTDTPFYAAQLYYKLRMIDEDGTARFSDLAVVKMKEVIGVSVYPNPSRDHLMVATDFEGTYTVEIWDQTGRSVINKRIESPLAKLNVSHLNPATYFVKVIGGERVEMAKFVKQ